MRFSALFLALIVASCGLVAPSFRDTDVNITSKAQFDPARYTGTWFEIARCPVSFQRGCTNTTATYNATSDPGLLEVKNECFRNGRVSAIDGFARVTGPGRLEVEFRNVPFVKAPYWVLWVDEDYQTAVVGTPSGRSGWILNRTPVLREDRLQAARDVLEFNGYDVSKLIMVQQ